MTDLRVTKTQLAIKDAFVSLVLESGFQSMTVSALANRTMINRQTFYKHYDDKYDLARQLNQEVLAWYDGLGQQRVDLAHEGRHIIDVIDAMRPTLNELAGPYGRTIQALRQVDLPDLNIVQSLRQRILKIATQVMGETADAFETAIIGSVFIGIVDYTINNGGMAPTEEIMASLNRLGRLFQ